MSALQLGIHRVVQGHLDSSGLSTILRGLLSFKFCLWVQRFQREHWEITEKKIVYRIINASKNGNKDEQFVLLYVSVGKLTFGHTDDENNA